MEYTEACKLAYEYYYEAKGVYGLSQAKDLGKKWIFYSVDQTPLFGGFNISVDKATGEIQPFRLPSEENFALLKSAVILSVPDEFQH